jgi:hypothetical protein
MRSAWIGSGAALAVALGLSLGAAALVAPGSAGDAWAQGVANKSKSGAAGYRSGKAVTGHRNAARPAPQLKGQSTRQQPRLKGRAFRPAPRVKRSFYRPVATKTCGQFRYWSTAKRTCLDARTSPPALK